MANHNVKEIKENTIDDKKGTKDTKVTFDSDIVDIKITNINYKGKHSEGKFFQTFHIYFITILYLF